MGLNWLHGGTSGNTLNTTDSEKDLGHKNHGLKQELRLGRGGSGQEGPLLGLIS